VYAAAPSPPFVVIIVCGATAAYACPVKLRIDIVTEMHGSTRESIGTASIRNATTRQAVLKLPAIVVMTLPEAVTWPMPTLANMARRASIAFTCAPLQAFTAAGRFLEGKYTPHPNRRQSLNRTPEIVKSQLGMAPGGLAPPEPKFWAESTGNG
jgi:hypothetical protein